MTTYVLGASRTGPDSWLFVPSFAGVDYARGRLPLEKGYLEVAWEKLSCGEIQITIVSPPGTHGELKLPSSPEEIHIPTQGGAYTFLIQQDCSISEESDR